MTLAMQVKLLQVIEEKVFTRLGGTNPISVDVRIIAATNHNLKDLVQQGRFREDLYYRLDVVPIHIPPLRERRDDIAALALNRLEKFNRTSGCAKRLDQAVMDRLMRYSYPGNVRELINIVERMMIMSDGNLITISDLPAELREQPQSNIDPFENGTTLAGAMEQFEGRVIVRALGCHKSLSMAARTLGVHPTTLWRKMTKFGISKPTAMSK